MATLRDFVEESRHFVVTHINCVELTGGEVFEDDNPYGIYYIKLQTDK